MKLRPNWHFTKWDDLNILFFIQYIRCFKNFWGSANILLQIPVKMGKKWRKFESSIFFEAQKYYFVFESRLFFSFFFKWSYSQSCFDVVQRCENQRWKWQSCFDVAWRCSIQLWKTQRCFNVVQRCRFQRWHTQRCFNADLTLCDVATSHGPKNNVEPTLKYLLGCMKEIIESCVCRALWRKIKEAMKAVILTTIVLNLVS